MRRRNPQGDAEVSELVAYITSRASGHEIARHYDAVSKNLAAKALKGKYDSALAVKGWRHVVDAAAKQYARDYGMEARDFTGAYRDRAARKLRDRWEDHTQVRINPAPRLGSGARFRKCVSQVEARGGAYDPRAVCAAAGRHKYGAKRFQKMAAKGRARAHNPSVPYYSKARAMKAAHEFRALGYAVKVLKHWEGNHEVYWVEYRPSKRRAA